MKKNFKIIIPPESGWKERTWYLVEKSMNFQNPIHRDLFYSGFLQNGDPCGYNHFAMNTEEISNIWDVYYLKAIREVASEKDLEYKGFDFPPSFYKIIF